MQGYATIRPTTTGGRLGRHPHRFDTVHHHLYFTSFANVPQITKVNLAMFRDAGTSTATYTMDSTTPGDGIARVGFDLPYFDEGLVIDRCTGTRTSGRTIPFPAESEA